MYTVYPELLAIIKFGNLHKIRLQFNIDENKIWRLHSKNNA